MFMELYCCSQIKRFVSKESLLEGFKIGLNVWSPSVKSGNITEWKQSTGMEGDVAIAFYSFFLYWSIKL